MKNMVRSQAMNATLGFARSLSMVLLKSLRMINSSLMEGISRTTRASHQSRMNHDLTFRLARSNDFDKILKVSEGLYNGHDYVPVRFHKWMKMQDLAVLLSYSGENPVGLLVCSVVDEGRTFVSRAARVVAEFRGQGVHKMQGKAMDEFVRKTFPNVRRKRLTKQDENFPLGRKIVQQDILSCYVEKATLRSHQIITGTSSMEIVPCTKEYLCDVIFASRVAQTLFPDNVIILDWFPIEPLRSNIEYLMQEHDLYFAVEGCTNGTSPRSISFGVPSPRVSKRVFYCATVYTSEEDLYKAHLVHQFKKSCEVVKDGFVFSCYQDKRFTNCGRRVLTEQLQLALDEERCKKTMNLYGINFP
ncbi:histidine N-acetyltransferase-like [Oculina patagonica]